MTFRDLMIRTSTLGTLSAGFLVFFPVLAIAEPTVTPSDQSFQQAVEQVVEQYIRSHPEVIEQTLQALQTKREDEERERVRQVIVTRQADLLSDPNSPISGDPKGDVTVVEFFDYRCGYCKRVAGTVTQLQKDDPRVRVVYKDFPILGEASELAAKAALASRAQGKHLAFHEALLASENEITKEELLRIANHVGLDTHRLQADMANPGWQAVIEKNRSLARELGITGTPGFIVGTEVVPGALNLNRLKGLVAQTRKGQ